MKNVIVLAELLKVYKEAKVDGFILGWTDGTDAVFSAIMIDDLTEENLYIMTQGKENFRQYKRNERWLKSLMEIERIPMNELEKIEEENNGYRAEIFLFGESNHTESKIDGTLYGRNWQLKTSFKNGNGSSNSNKFL
jgi:hypothetical protein